MNKKGFTLVEVIGIILILSIIAVIITPSVISVVNNSKKTSNDIQKELIIKYAKLWVEEHSELISDEDGSIYSLSLQDLAKDGYLTNKEYVDIENDQSLNNACVKITTKKAKYSYEFVNDCT